MATTLRREDDGICQLEIRGLLTKADLDRAQQALLDILASDRGRAVQLLVRLEDFEGWEPDPRWNDLTFYIGHGDALERIAIVGEERWRGRGDAVCRSGPAQGAGRVLHAGPRTRGTGLAQRRVAVEKRGAYRAVGSSAATTRCQFASGLKAAIFFTALAVSAPRSRS